MAADNLKRTQPNPPAAASGERVREKKRAEVERSLTRCVYCGRLPTVVHWRCVRCDRIACARCVVADLKFEWLCPDCAEVLGGGLRRC